MSIAVTGSAIDDLTLTITEEIHVKATPEATFDALVEELGRGMTGAENQSMPLTIEAWPGGRWYRDLGDGNGHLWAHVQAIKRPTLLEFYGPLMMSFAVASNVQYRVSQEQGGTLIKFHHYAVGAIPADVRTAMEEGWHTILERAKQRAEKQ
jgi:uncharacterized protein YndB with AHSA1/START domain